MMGGELVQNPVYLGSIIWIYLIGFGLSKMIGFELYRTKDIMKGIIKKISKEIKIKRKNN